MKYLLWTLVIAGALNTAAVLLAGITGGLRPIEPWMRALDALYAFGLMCWALWLLAKL